MIGFSGVYMHRGETLLLQLSFPLDHPLINKAAINGKKEVHGPPIYATDWDRLSDP